MKYKTVRVIDHHATADYWRAKRKVAGVTGRAVASKMGFTPSYVSDLENGRRNWTTAKEKAYEDALLGLAIPVKRVLEFESIGQCRPEGREGSVLLYVECDRDRDSLDDFSPIVQVDGQLHRVRGFETTGAPYRKGERIGIVVKDQAYEKGEG